jgi:membrane-bound ClpP family serine protease
VELDLMKVRPLVGGCFLILLGFALFIVRGMELALILPVVGLVLLVFGFLYKPRKKAETP